MPDVSKCVSPFDVGRAEVRVIEPTDAPGTTAVDLVLMGDAASGLALGFLLRDRGEVLMIIDALHDAMRHAWPQPDIQMK